MEHPSFCDKLRRILQQKNTIKENVFLKSFLRVSIIHIKFSRILRSIETAIFWICMVNIQVYYETHSLAQKEPTHLPIGVTAR